jgi:DhnA family fructose-bisphosphate aldolase class Ia
MQTGTRNGSRIRKQSNPDAVFRFKRSNQTLVLFAGRRIGPKNHSWEKQKMARLDDKLSRILAGTGSPADFIIADAKDGDMGFATTAPGPRIGADGKPTGGFKTLAEYLDQMRAIVAQDLVDIMLTSVSCFERLAAGGTFDGSPVTPAIRANDSTDIWNTRHANYLKQASRPFRSANLAHARRLGCDLCLYSMTFVNDVDADLRTLQAFSDFRADAEETGMRYFLEVFNPNVETGIDASDIGYFVNDNILHALAGLSEAESPLFLKIAYNGAAAMDELCAYDDQLVVGVLGGSAGTSADTFTLLRQAASHGAKVALFGRKINLAESPLDVVAMMRKVVEGELTPEEAVRAYHAALEEKNIRPFRNLDDDLQLTEAILVSEAG